MTEREQNNENQGRRSGQSIRIWSTFTPDRQLVALAVIVLTVQLLGGLVVGVAGAEPVRHITVPDGFEVQRATAPGMVQFPMFAVFDDRGRLFVAESSGLDLYKELAAQTRKCRIRVLEDTDSDGRFEAARVFAEGLVFPMGLAWRDGRLFVADPPDVVMLEDTDGDGRSDRRTVILTGFGHATNGSLHGLVFGPDGWLYMTTGSPDGYRLRQADGSLLEGKSGALVRCRADGSDPQVLSRGLVNLVEVAYTSRGELFGTVNWFRDVNQPGSQGMRDALVHLVEGGLYPFYRDVGTPQVVTGKPLGAVSLLPAVAISGLTEYRGQTFPTEMRGNLFSAQHNSRKIGRHVLVPHGSTYRSQDVDFVSSEDPDFHPSDVVLDANGSLLIVDTGSWYIHHCPTGTIRNTRAPGGIYRVRWKAAAKPDDPWGLKENFETSSLSELAALLHDARPAVRDRAAVKLLAAGELAAGALSTALTHGTGDASASSFESLENTAWILSGIGGELALTPLRKALTDSRPAVAAAAARALAQHKDSKSASRLRVLLTANSAIVRRTAADALAHCGNEESLPAIWQALSQDPDRFLEHALVHAAHRLASAQQLTAALRQPHPRVRRAALVLLSQPPRSREALSQQMVLASIGEDDIELRTTALALLLDRPEWSATALDLTNGWLKEMNVANDRVDDLKKIVLAFQTSVKMQEIVADALANDASVSTKLRIALLEVLADSDVVPQPSAWVSALGRVFDDANASVRAQAVRTAAVWRLPQFDRSLAKIADSESEAIELRLSALQAIGSRRATIAPAVFTMLVSQLAEDVSPLRRLTSAEILGKSSLADAQLRIVLRTVSGDPLISPEIVLADEVRDAGEATVSDVLDFLAASIESGWRPTETRLQEIIAALPAADQQVTDRLVAALRRELAGQQSRLDELEELLDHGDPDKGRAVFFDQKTACAACHRVGSEGGDVGPDLTKIGSVRAGADILESIVFPGASIAQDYQSYLVTTTKGRSMTGIVVDKSHSMLLLREPSGAHHRLKLDDVETMDRARASLMPEALSKVMSRDELRDLLAYLQLLK